MKNTNKTDRQLSELLKSNLPDAPYNPWFTRTVLNRLPEKKKRTAANIEIWVCVIGAIITTVFGVRYAIESYSSDYITVQTLVGYGIYLTLFGALVANIAMPLVKRGISRG
ncbi:MAG: hypothetical protein K2M11_02740 [Paramuribaculum sp.]|nr:hypothetical protein [Paramuribaculum sp.]